MCTKASASPYRLAQNIANPATPASETTAAAAARAASRRLARLVQATYSRMTNTTTPAERVAPANAPARPANDNLSVRMASIAADRNVTNIASVGCDAGHPYRQIRSE